MKRLAIVLAVLTFAYLPCSASSLWSTVAEKLKASTVFIETTDAEGSGTCSGFMIDSKKHQVLTAGHCDGDKILVDGTQAIKLYKDTRKDLLVLRAYNVDRPALKLSKIEPEVGDDVASFGFGYGLESPMFRVAHISNAKLEIEELSGPFVVIDATVIPGQSGGPIVNLQGDVIGIVQRTTPGFGLGVGVDTIKNRVGRYFE